MLRLKVSFYGCNLGVHKQLIGFQSRYGSGKLGIIETILLLALSNFACKLSVHLIDGLGLRSLGGLDSR